MVRPLSPLTRSSLFSCPVHASQWAAAGAALRLPEHRPVGGHPVPGHLHGITDDQSGNGSPFIRAVLICVPLMVTVSGLDSTSYWFVSRLNPYGSKKIGVTPRSSRLSNSALVILVPVRDPGVISSHDEVVAAHVLATDRSEDRCTWPAVARVGGERAENDLAGRIHARLQQHLIALQDRT